MIQQHSYVTYDKQCLFKRYAMLILCLENACFLHELKLFRFNNSLMHALSTLKKFICFV